MPMPDPDLAHDPKARDIASNDPTLPGGVDPGAGPLVHTPEEGRYAARRVLGRGGMGEVELCWDAVVRRDVAMKTLLRDHAESAEARARFLREARVQGQLEHPAIVPVYDLGARADGTVFFTMKRLRGMTLAEVLKSLRAGDAQAAAAWPRARLFDAFRAACLAVDFAHSRGVVHRDLKPSNVMLGDFGEVYVLDWGIAKLHGHDDDGADPAEPVDVADDELATRAGRLMGTLGYMSPEQARGRAVDARSDVFSLGAILFELLTLEPLVARDVPNAMLYATIEGPDARASRRAPDREVPPELEAIAVRATRRDPEERFPSARALADATEAYQHGDRDLELRRTMAASHAEAAAAEIETALAGGDRADTARRRALREIGRALALDPEQATAIDAFARIVAEPPRTVPAEVERARAELVAVRARLRQREITRAVMLIPPLFLGMLLWMGVLRPAVFVVLGATFVVLAAIRVFAKKNPEHAMRLFYVDVVLNTLLVTCIGRVFGPLLGMPTALCLLTITFAMMDDARRRFFGLATVLTALVGSMALEVLGVLPRSYAFEADRLVILPDAVHLAPLATTAMLFVMAAFAIVITFVGIGGLRGHVEQTQREALLHAWQLHQLLPERARRPLVDPVRAR